MLLIFHGTFLFFIQTYLFAFPSNTLICILIGSERENELISSLRS